MKRIVLAALFAAAFATGAIAQTSYPVPPRDPPFGKGELRNETAHLPSSATTQGKASDTGKGEVQKSAKSKDARNKSALKKDNTKNGAKPDSAPKSDTD